MPESLRRWFDHEHRDVQRTLDLLHVVSGSPCPPSGHAFWQYLRSGASHLAVELPRHVAAEEVELYPRLSEAFGDEVVQSLREEHRAIREALEPFVAAVAAVEEAPGPGRWSSFQLLAGRLEVNLREHFQHEERWLHELKRSMARAPSPS